MSLITTMDPRYGDPNAVAMAWEETRRVLETAEVFWLSTVRADGARMLRQSLPCGTRGSPLQHGRRRTEGRQPA
jgi:hypothetical protein